MCETQECSGVERAMSTVQEENPGSPACSVSSECEWGHCKRQEGPGWSVSLRQSRKGFKCHALIDAQLPVSPDAAFSILTDPEVKQWRQVKECTFRKVWEDDGNVQKVEVEQSATAFFKTIHTRMHVVQDRAAGTMRFTLAKPGMLKHFEGQWTVTAVEGEAQASHVHLEQTMQPGFAPPPPFKRFFRKAMLSKASQMLVQLQEEAVRSSTGAEEPAGKPGQLAHQLSFNITAYAGPAGASPVPQPRQERCQPVPSTPEPSAQVHALPTDAMFAKWRRLVEPAGPIAAQHSAMGLRATLPWTVRQQHAAVRSHPICCDADSDSED